MCPTLKMRLTRMMVTILLHYDKEEWLPQSNLFFIILCIFLSSAKHISYEIINSEKES